MSRQYHFSLERLLSEGIPLIETFKIISSASSRSSNYETAVLVERNDISIDDSAVEEILDINKADPSLILTHCNK